MAEVTLKPSQFADLSGRVWTLNIDLDSIEQVRSETNVSIYELLNDECRPLAELLNNMPVVAHVGYVLADAEAAGVDRKSFVKSLKGDPFSHLVDAFLQELADFFPDSRRRAAIAKLTTAWKSLENQALDRLATALEKIDPHEVARTVLTKMLSTKSGASSATSESTPSEPES